MLNPVTAPCCLTISQRIVCKLITRPVTPPLTCPLKCFVENPSGVALVVKNLHANAGDVRGHGFDPWIRGSLEEGQDIHSSVLVWRNPWTEEPDRLESMGLHRVGHN